MKTSFLVAGLGLALAATAPGSTGSPVGRDVALISCGTTRTIGIAAPTSGPAASIGRQQLRWARFYVRRYNRSHRTKFRLLHGDTKLPDTTQAALVAAQFAASPELLAVVGPAGSQEVQAATPTLVNAGLGFVSGSATRTALTTDSTRKGFLFRTVPNDDRQGPRVANWIRRLRTRHVVIVDAQNSYSTSLANTVEGLLRNANFAVTRESVDEANTTDFSALVARIPAETQVVYIPWQLAGKAALFARQLRAGGIRARLFGSDGLFDPRRFKVRRALVSFFPIDLKSKIVAAYRKGPGKGRRDLFGLPSYAAAQVVGRAIDKACKDGTATRAEVRDNINSTVIHKRLSVLGFPMRFVQRVNFPLGPGDLRSPADFGIYRIRANGAYVRVG